MRRLLWVVVVAAVSASSMALPAFAHGDERLVADRVSVEPGGRAVFAGDVHYHRIVGRFSASGPVTVSVVDPDTGTVLTSRGPAVEITLNELIPCCDGATWTIHHLVIENGTDEAVEVDARASLVHDDVAVSVFRAESGVIESMLALGGIWAYALRRRRRRGATTHHRRAVTSAIVLATVVLALWTYGTLRYGSGGTAGLLAGLADVPVLPMNPLVSRASLLLGLIMIGWAVTGAHWASSRGDAGRITWLIHGIVVAGMVLVAAFTVSIGYRTAGVPALIGALALIPIASLAWVDGRPRPANATAEGSRPASRRSSGSASETTVGSFATPETQTEPRSD